MTSGLHRAVLVLLLAMGVAGCDDGASAKSVSGLPMERLDGVSETIDHYRGKVVVLNVWATWCGPCRVEMPELQKLADSLGSDGYAVLGLSIDDTPALVSEYLRQRKLTFARHIDRGGRQAKPRLGIVSVPFTLILGRDGTVLWSSAGRREWGDPAVATWVRGLK